jgi:hypothetical protein
MRIPTAILLAVLLGACRTPGPGQVDPTRYPWDPRNAPPPAPPPHPRVDARGLINPNPEWRKPPPPAPQPSTAEGSYCVMAIEQESKTGIVLGGNAGVMACTAQPNSPPPATPK